MLDNYLRLGTTLCWLVMALVAVGNALTLNAAWRRRGRTRGLGYNQRLAVAGALVLLATAIVGVVYAVSVMV